MANPDLKKFQNKKIPAFLTKKPVFFILYKFKSALIVVAKYPILVSFAVPGSPFLWRLLILLFGQNLYNNLPFFALSHLLLGANEIGHNKSFHPIVPAKDATLRHAYLRIRQLLPYMHLPKQKIQILRPTDH